MDEAADQVVDEDFPTLYIQTPKLGRPAAALFHMMGKPVLWMWSLRLLFILFLSSTDHMPFCGRAQQIGGAKTTNFDVGVVLDTKSWIGNISWTCMEIALDDFYAAHRNYTTRLTFHLRDSDQDAFSAAAAVVDLLKNVQVQAIIGPQTSTQAKFAIDLGNKTHVPIISFSAKSPSLSTKQSPYFVRTASNDSSQAQVIASLVKKFNWREVVPVVEDTDYGLGIVPSLIDAFQEIGTNVPYRSVISPLASNNQIMEELTMLRNRRTRVFVVHMRYQLGMNLFSIAKAAGMMGEGYVWIATYGLTDVVDILGSTATDVMEGVLGVKPYVTETNKLLDFNARWRKRFHQEDNSTSTNSIITKPTVFGLWAYDTVWSLALAAEVAGVLNSTFIKPDIRNTTFSDMERLGISQNGPKLVHALQNITFEGMSGMFHLNGGQLESKSFQIISVIDSGLKSIGFWTPTGDIKFTDDPGTIVWPGNSTKMPRGWEWPTSGKRLRIGVPVKPGFHEFVDLESGYCIRVFDAVMESLNYSVPYEYVLYEDGKGKSNGTYDELVYQVYLQNFDAVVGDITIIANRSLYVDFTLPFTESGVSMLVPIKDKQKKSPWAFLDPLTTDLWLATGAFFFFTGFVVWILEHRINWEFRGTPAQQVGTTIYFSFSTLVFAHREKVLNNLSRVVVIIWLFVVLIITQSYTASLTSMLTVQQLEPTLTDLDSLIRDGFSVGYLNDSFMPQLLHQMSVPQNKIEAYDSPEEYHKAMSNGSVAAIVDEIPYLKVFLSRYCNKYTMVGPTYKTDGFGFAFPKGSPLVRDVSRAILHVTESDRMLDFDKDLYGDETCPDQASTTTSNGLTFNSFWGLFLITGITSIFAIMVHVILFLYEHSDVLRAHNSDSNLSVREKLALLAKLLGQMGTSSHQPEKTEDQNEPPISGILATPISISGPQSPLSMSSPAHADFGGLEEDTGTPSEEEEEEEDPGRDISRENVDPPSFADMLNQRN